MIDSTTNDPLAGLGLRTTGDLQAKEGPRNRLGQEDFLELMIAQLRNQDPMKPMENGEFLSQMAQFGTVQGIQDMQGSFKTLSESLYSNQALQAASLVGHSVLVPTGEGVLPENGTLKGAVDLPASSNEVRVKIHSPSGELVRSVELGAQPAGQFQFQWDGIGNDGEPVPPGRYLVTAEALYEDGHEAVETLTVADVNSVTLNRSGGLQLNLDGLGTMEFSEVRQIM